MFVGKLEDIASDPEEWIAKAEELQYSAEILFDFEKNRTRLKRRFIKDIYISSNISVMPQVLMLYGLALEVLIKSLAVKRGIIKIENDKLNVNHETLKLIDKLQINLDIYEKEYLTKIIRHVLWEGKYPCTADRKYHIEEYNLNNINEWRFTYVGDKDFKKVDYIYKKIYAIVDEELSK